MLLVVLVWVGWQGVLAHLSIACVHVKVLIALLSKRVTVRVALYYCMLLYVCCCAIAIAAGAVGVVRAPKQARAQQLLCA